MRLPLKRRRETRLSWCLVSCETCERDRFLQGHPAPRASRWRAHLSVGRMFHFWFTLSTIVMEGNKKNHRVAAPRGSTRRVTFEEKGIKWGFSSSWRLWHFFSLFLNSTVSSYRSSTKHHVCISRFHWRRFSLRTWHLHQASCHQPANVSSSQVRVHF